MLLVFNSVTSRSNTILRVTMIGGHNTLATHFVSALVCDSRRPLDHWAAILAEHSSLPFDCHANPAIGWIHILCLGQCLHGAKPLWFSQGNLGCRHEIDSLALGLSIVHHKG